MDHPRRMKKIGKIVNESKNYTIGRIGRVGTIGKVVKVVKVGSIG